MNGTPITLGWNGGALRHNQFSPYFYRIFCAAIAQTAFKPELLYFTHKCYMINHEENTHRVLDQGQGYEYFVMNLENVSLCCNISNTSRHTVLNLCTYVQYV